MKALFDEISRRFPEVRSRLSDGDEELPYLAMGSVVDWLRSLSPSQITPDIMQRVTEFRGWCEQQPRGETAGDDVYTVLVVAFYEKLFAKDVTRRLIPRLIPKDDLIQNAEYLKTWVGSENYQLALEQY
jgi:hypothetical protein